MHELLIPDELAGVGVERNEAITEQSIAETMAAVKFGASAGSDRYEDEAALGIEREKAPNVGAELRVPAIANPRFVSRLAGLRPGVERPDEFAGVGVPCAHHLDSVFTCDDQIAVNHG